MFAGLLPIVRRTADWMAPASCGTMSRNLWCSGPFSRGSAGMVRNVLCRRSRTNNLLRLRGYGLQLERLVRRIIESEALVQTYKLTVNGQPKEVTVDPGTPLLWVLREDLKMTGTKYGCGISACGACTVHVAGVATRSCVVPVSLIGDRPIVTIEGIGQDRVGRAVQDAWVAEDVVQCGYCQSGQIMSAVALLERQRRPTDADIEESMGGNICRCGTYVRIRKAIKAASEQLA